MELKLAARILSEDVATCWGLVVLFVGSVLPIWRVWHINSCCDCGSIGILWDAMAKFPSQMELVGFRTALIDYHLESVVQAGILFVVAAATGGIRFWFLSRLIAPYLCGQHP